MLQVVPQFDITILTMYVHCIIKSIPVQVAIFNQTLNKQFPVSQKYPYYSRGVEGVFLTQSNFFFTSKDPCPDFTQNLSKN